MCEIGAARGYLHVTDEHVEYLPVGRRYAKDAEELVRAAVYVEMIVQYGYPEGNIAIEVQVPHRLSNIAADIVVYRDRAHTDPYAVVETKRENISDREFNQAVEQGFGNANSLRSAYLIVDSWAERRCWDVSGFPSAERQKNRQPDIPTSYAEAPEFTFWRSTPPRSDLRIVDLAGMSRVFRRCHAILWQGGKLNPADAFDEMSKVMFAKIRDERSTHNGDPYLLQIGSNEAAATVANRVRERYAEAREADPSIFKENIATSDQRLNDIVRNLQDISLTATDLDAKGQAFEEFLGVVFRGELGQFFTRRELVRFLVQLASPRENDTILDPACGSGGFLLHSMRHVLDQMQQDYAGDDRTLHHKETEFCQRHVCGIEVNAQIARVAMMDMIVNDDGHSNIVNFSGLLPEYANEWIGHGRFSVVLMNPPFGDDVKPDDRDKLGTAAPADFAELWPRIGSKQISDLLFLKRAADFLTDQATRTPRMGVVLQMGILNNSSLSYAMRWLRDTFEIKAVVALPSYAFRKTGSGMRTALLYAEKRPYPERTNPDYPVFMAIARSIGYDSTFRPDDDELNNVLLPLYQAGPAALPRPAAGGPIAYWLRASELSDRLDPLYYHLGFIITEELQRLHDGGIVTQPLWDLIRGDGASKEFEAGASPAGGITHSTGEIPAITITNMTPDGDIDYASIENFVPRSFYDEKAAKAGIQEGDILIAKDGATTGKTSLVDAQCPFRDAAGQIECIISEHVFRMRMCEGVNPGYVYAYLNSRLGRLQIDRIVSGGAQGGITRDFPMQIQIPVLSVPEQTAIADQFAGRLADLRRLRQDIADAKDQAACAVDDFLQCRIQEG
jgi:type I restriction enzyme M protein